ncbi:MAG: hypothetical protein PHN88_01055 [Ignavibacteria bacterium]|nr:hypothetical protein [Ignavibacteria bacterium]
MKNKLIYSLTIEDIQAVASQEINRHLQPEEIGKLIKYIAERIGTL